MSTIHRLKSIQRLPTGLEDAWKFFSDPHNLIEITPPGLNLRTTTEVFGNQVYAGQVMTYSVKPLLGIAVSWMTEITHVDPLRLFVDEQRKGPYRLWHHQHHFKKIDGGVEMTDIVSYLLPFGAFGNIFHSIVRKKLEEIFQYRYQRITERFGAWPGAGMELYIS